MLELVAYGDLEVRPAVIRKMRCFIIVDTRTEMVIERQTDDGKISHFWGKGEANDFANYLTDKLI